MAGRQVPSVMNGKATAKTSTNINNLKNSFIDIQIQFVEL